ncbi:MAG: Hsp20/alpha crystallin family protein [Bacteroidales bacterium]|nr:Hsp20/alpha crystallin family protein [Bacteroidales bacterium]
MTLVKRSNNTFPSVPSLIDSLFSRELMDWTNTNFSSTDTTLPAVNISETDNEYSIEVAAPGMKRDNFKIKLENNLLSISSEQKEEKSEKADKGKYSRREFSYQSFQRTFNLPENEIDGDKIKAAYADGILTLTLPKREEVKPKPAREIKIA